MFVHALHTVHALPDLRVAGGRLGDGVSVTYGRRAIVIIWTTQYSSFIDFTSA
jgi:hypothetical protein